MTSSAPVRPDPRIAGVLPLLLVALLPLAVALASQLAPAGGPVAAVFPPWWRGTAAFAAAGRVAPVLGIGGLPFIVIVAGGTEQRLRAAGAWLVLDARGAALCRPANAGTGEGAQP